MLHSIQNLSPLGIQTLFLSLLWLLILLVGITFLAPKRTEETPAPAGSPSSGSGANSKAPGNDSIQMGASTDPELMVEYPATGEVESRMQRLAISSSQVLIGRSSHCDLRLENEFVSAEHARIRQTDGKLVLEDLKSTNGTFVNDLPAVRPVPLNTGDTIRIGTIHIRVVSAGGE